MFRTVFEFIISVVTRAVLIFLLSYPGAFFRWLLGSREKPLRDYFNYDTFVNGSVGMLILMLLGIAVFILFQL